VCVLRELCRRSNARVDEEIESGVEGSSGSSGINAAVVDDKKDVWLRALATAVVVDVRKVKTTPPPGTGASSLSSLSSTKPWACCAAESTSPSAPRTMGGE
jgi:hypothetical protein